MILDFFGVLHSAFKQLFNSHLEQYLIQYVIYLSLKF